MFGEKKISQSLIDAVTKVMENKETQPIDEAQSQKVPTATGMKVYGHRYGDSASAHKAQTRHSVDDVKEPTKKDIEKDSKLYVKDTGQKRTYKVHSGRYFSNYEKGIPTKGKEEPRYKNEEVELDEAGNCVTKPEAKDIAKKEVKGHEKSMHHKEDYSFASRLIDHIIMAEEVELELNEVLSKDASAGDWIHDFVHSDNPKFKGKSKAMRKKMALAAYYAKQRNEEVEKHDDEKEDKALVKKMVKKDALKKEEEESGLRMAAHAAAKQGKKAFQFLGKTYPVKVKKEEVELDEAKVTTSDDNPDRITTDMLKGREEGGKSNSFKSFKLKLKTDGEMKAPEEEKPEDTTARKSIKAKEGIGDKVDKLDPKFGRSGSVKEETELDEVAKGTDIADKKEKMARLSNTGKGKPMHNVAKGLKAFLKGKAEPMESVEEDSKPFKKNPVPANKPAYKVKAFEAKTLSPGQDDAPFEPPYAKAQGNVKDKSGAVHTPMSRARDLARKAMKRIKTEMLGKAPGNN